MISRISHSRSGFTLVELLVGMTVFAIGMTGILALLGNTFASAKYASHEVVVAWILREQMELVKNARDSNLKNYATWDKILLSDNSTTTWTGGVYLIENNFNDSTVSYEWDGKIHQSPILLKNITQNFPLDIAQIWSRTKLYRDSQDRYTHNAVSPVIETPYASYLKITPLAYDDNWQSVLVQKDGKNQWWIIDARVIVKTGNNYREYDAKTLITDWIK